MTRRPHFLLTLLVYLVALFLIAPTVIVIVMSFSSGESLHFPPVHWSMQWYENLIQSPDWRAVILTSLKVGAASSVLATVLGTMASLAFVRGRFPLRGVVTSMVVAPLIVPVIIVAVGMYFMYVRWGIQGTLGGLIASHTSLGMPLVIVSVVASLQNFDRNLEMAAQSLGAGPVRTFLRITLPLILPGVLAGALFAFMTSWDEVVTAIFLSSARVRTLPVMMWTVVQSEVDPTIAALASMLTVFTVLLLLATVVARRVGLKR